MLKLPWKAPFSEGIKEPFPPVSKFHCVCLMWKPQWKRNWHRALIKWDQQLFRSAFPPFSSTSTPVMEKRACIYIKKYFCCERNGFTSSIFIQIHWSLKPYRRIRKIPWEDVISADIFKGGEEKWFKSMDFLILLTGFHGDICHVIHFYFPTSTTFSEIPERRVRHQ